MVIPQKGRKHHNDAAPAAVTVPGIRGPGRSRKESSCREGSGTGAGGVYSPGFGEDGGIGGLGTPVG
ncbi:hypothetical protein A2911_01095 [Candidatus Nomurabacteria bacterium RIFCSPLOWO2_01_FULL_40_15]|uniref:Uncharacterized protein n=1 Tax=Candidatus Nomurabacteria bacterium RIFCSPLOWO2_01_FULL_40_15 TaxID=1801772 RepID=A0A1F6X5G8_9BACT|nr:MAG: hypothetical protein A2911_01095 [Candidatus Nomurabacteria bacterium RIFCSPLOWO2_01_FULL_40_15]